MLDLENSKLAYLVWFSHLRLMALFILIVSNLNLALDDRHSAKALTLNILTSGYDMDEGHKVLNFLLLLIMFRALASGFFKLFYFIISKPTLSFIPYHFTSLSTSQLFFLILLIKIIYLPNKIYFFLFCFFSIFSSPCIYIFQTFLYFSPSFRLLHTRLHYSQAPSTSSTAPPLPSHHHRASTMPTTPPLPTKIPLEQKPIFKKKKKKKKTQINPDQNSDTAAVRSTLPLSLLDQRFLHRWSTPIKTQSPPPLDQRFLHRWSTHHRWESQHHNRERERKKKPYQCFLHCDVWCWCWEEDDVWVWREERADEKERRRREKRIEIMRERREKYRRKGE